MVYNFASGRALNMKGSAYRSCSSSWAAAAVIISPPVRTSVNQGLRRPIPFKNRSLAGYRRGELKGLFLRPAIS